MPSAAEILSSLTEIANRAIVGAVAWHALVALAAVALAVGFRPSQRVASLLLSLPLASVSIAAWSFGNPFNGAVFAVAAIGLGGLAVRASTDPVEIGARWASVLGAGLIAFAWLYPHFLVGHSPLAYLDAAPLGMLPCPTLALVTGAALCGNGLAGGAWRWSLVGIAAFYALFGWLRLGVVLDVGLLFGPIGLVLQHLRARRPSGEYAAVR